MSSEHLKSVEDKGDESCELNQVHSANKWENADLGDDSRKQKFLRLMGASKKEHHGKIVIGDHDKPHERSKEKTEEIAEGLEEQYNEALHHKKVSGYKGHSGLGFSEEQEKKEEDSEEANKDTKVTPSTEPDQEKKDDDNNQEKVAEKHKLEEDKSEKEDEKEDKKEDEPSDPKKKKFMMNFVKASS
ncbi:hypothetical protein FSP39_014905 [Pinctada imbricata]|uniref:Small acidic protein n=1 Tax=Pinctada imbricata TaxID=66713 RepID=A0AA88Y4Z6_PINIB|nr:hypothetical protein FSP39_014905 [Pinctada imbricata]